MKPAGSACETCPGRDLQCVLPEPSRGRAKLAIVGEAPGWNEKDQGRPFVGKSGRMLERGLKTIGVLRSEVHWTNAMLCDVGPDLKLQKLAAKACSSRLRAELAAAGAPVIMPVGAWALQGVLNLPKKPQILKWRGSVSRIELPRQPSGDPAVASGLEGPSSHVPGSGEGPSVSLVAPTVHPAFVMRAPGWGPLLQTDVARVGRLLENGFQAPEESRILLIPRDLSSLASAFKSLQGSALSFDVETVGLGFHSTPLVCYGLSDGAVTVVVPWSKERDGAQNFWPNGQAGQVIRMTNDLLADRVMVTHNGPNADHIVARRYGIRWGKWDDTLLAQHVVRSHLPKNLAHVVTSYIDVPPWKQLEDRTATIERLWTYNGRDCLYTILAWFEIKKEIR